MGKFILVTGLGPSPDNQLIPCDNVFIVRKTGGGSHNTVRLDYFLSDDLGDQVTVEHAAGTPAENVTMCNFIADLILKAKQQKHGKPYLEIDAADFPSAVTNVTIA